MTRWPTMADYLAMHRRKRMELGTGTDVGNMHMHAKLHAKVLLELYRELLVKHEQTQFPNAAEDALGSCKLNTSML